MRDVDAVEQHAARRRIVEAQQQLERRALARAGRPDERDRLAGLDLHPEVVECLRLRSRRIAEGHVVELNSAAMRARQLDRQCRRLNRRGSALELDEPFHRAGRTLHVAPHFAQGRGRDAHVARVEKELRQLAEREAPREHLVRADPEHERDAAEHERRRERGQHAANLDPPHRDDERALHRVAKALRVQVLERERLNGLNRVDGLSRERARVREAILRVSRESPQAPAEHQERRDDERHHHHDDQREAQARRDQQHERADQRDDRPQCDRDPVAGDRLHERRVRREPRQHLAGARDLEESRVHADHARVDRVANVGDDALAEPRNHVETQRRERSERDCGREERDEIGIDRRGVADGETLIDQETQSDR